MSADVEAGGQAGGQVGGQVVDLTDGQGREGAGGPVPAGDAEVVLCRVDELAVGEGRAFALDSAQVAVSLTRHGDVHVLDAACPHAGGPLADGQSDAAVVVCPLHLNVFELATGACRPGAPDARSWRSRVVGGEVLVTA